MRCWFSSGDVCSSQCRDTVCDHLCRPQPIGHGANLSAFEGCEVLLGGLTIANLPMHIDETALSVLAGVSKIAGPLRIINNQYLTSLSFLANVDTLERLEITNNPNLIDARLPQLDVDDMKLSLARQPHDNDDPPGFGFHGGRGGPGGPNGASGSNPSISQGFSSSGRAYVFYRNPRVCKQRQPAMGIEAGLGGPEAGLSLPGGIPCAELDLLFQVRYSNAFRNNDLFVATIAAVTNLPTSQARID
jgi:hypothetical protein